MPPSKVASFEFKSFSWSPTKERLFLWSSSISILLRFFIKTNQETISLPKYFFVSPSPPPKKNTHKHLVVFLFPNWLLFFSMPKKTTQLDPRKTHHPVVTSDDQVPHRSSASTALRRSAGASPGGGHRRGGAGRIVLRAVDLGGGQCTPTRGGLEQRGMMIRVENLRGGRGVIWFFWGKLHEVPKYSGEMMYIQYIRYSFFYTYIWQRNIVFKEKYHEITS